MSKYLTFPDAQFRNRDLLVKALCDLGWKQEQIEVHATAQHLVGYRGDTRAETAEVIIRRTHIGSSSNDIGFKTDATGAYVPILSEYDKGHLRRRAAGADFVPKLRAAYNEEVARTVATRLRGRITASQVGHTRKIIVSY